MRDRRIALLPAVDRADVEIKAKALAVLLPDDICDDADVVRALVDDLRRALPAAGQRPTIGP